MTTPAVADPSNPSTLPDLATLAAQEVHDVWLARHGGDEVAVSRRDGVTNLLVPFAQLPPRDQADDHATVEAVFTVLRQAGPEAVVRMLWRSREDQPDALVMYRGKRLSVLMLGDMAAGVEGYECVQWYDGRPFVAALLHRTTKAGLEFGFSNEYVPAWTGQSLSAVTGVAECDDLILDVMREVAEETGFHVEADRLLRLGRVQAGKGLRNWHELFAVDVTGLEPGEAIGTAAGIVWVPFAQVPLLLDAVAHTLMLRLEVCVEPDTAAGCACRSGDASR